MKFKNIFVTMAAAVCLAGCTNLDEEIYSAIPKDSFFSSEEQLLVYSARAYNKLQAWGSEQSIWTLNLQLGNEVAAPKNSVNDWVDPRYKELQTHNFSASNKLIRMGWDYCFDGIAACNDVIYEIEHSELKFDGKERILAEMKVLRTFYYFLAVDNWANVPFSIDKSDKSLPQRKERSFMCPFMEKEILDNLEYLAPTPVVSSISYYGRITQAVAYTLLAKLYLNWEVWMGTPRWADAEKACKAVMDIPGYSLAENYRDNFLVHNESSPEAIFAIPYSTVYTQSDHNDFVIFIMTLSPTMCKESYNIPAAGWDGFVCQPDYFATYDAADKRKEYTWLYGQQYNLAKAPIPGFVIDPAVDESMYEGSRPELNGARIGKWEYQTDGLLTSDQTSMENDFFVFRLADVVLMRVEALVRQGKAGEAASIPEFKTIRTRAGLQPMTAGELTLENLLIERGHELCLEGWQRQDLIRFGKFLDPWWKKGKSPSTALLLPIPRERLGANNNLQQNPGY